MSGKKLDGRSKEARAAKKLLQPLMSAAESAASIPVPVPAKSHKLSAEEMRKDMIASRPKGFSNMTSSEEQRWDQEWIRQNQDLYEP